MKKVEISPSILSADFGQLNKEVASIEKYSDRIHYDVMDGHFVPNLTIGAPVLKHLKTKLPIEAHLMISNPEQYVEDFAKAGATTILVHQEATNHLHRLIYQIKDLGVKAGVVLNPATPLMMIEDILDDLDQVLLMTVNPGFGGQSFIKSVLPKIAELREAMPDLDIEVDGGVNDKTVKAVVEAGANVLVSGSYIFGAKDRKKAIEKLRKA